MNDNNTKTVLVTGGNGFIGTLLCKLLVDTGHTVINIDRTKKQQPGVTLYPFDIDNSQVDGVIKLTKPDTIIHLAADHEVVFVVSDLVVQLMRIGRVGHLIFSVVIVVVIRWSSLERNVRCSG